MIATRFLVNRLLLIAFIVTVTPSKVFAIDFAKLFAEVSSSVAKIQTQKIKISATGIMMEPGVGSGFLIEPDLVMTAAHVVADADRVRVRFTEDLSIDASVVALLDKSDVAMLRLEHPHPKPVLAKLGDSNAALVGSSVFVVGAPYGLEQTLSVGYLSGRMQRGKSASGDPIEFLQTDTAINPGNSGGPMFNEQGEVIGVVSFILSKSGGFDGIGFAGAISSAHKALQASSSFLAGFDGLTLSSKLKRALGMPNDGVLVQRVISESVADEIGLKAGTIPARIGSQNLLLGGDIIMSVDCATCTQSQDSLAISDIADQLSSDNALVVTVYRQGEKLELTKSGSESEVNLAELVGQYPQL